MGGIILSHQRVTPPLALLFDVLLFLASSTASTHAVGGVGAARAALGQVVVSQKPCHVTQSPLGPKQGCNLSFLLSVT